MVDLANDKQPRTRIRVCRNIGDSPVLESDWEMIRIEPDSGNIVAERDGKRIVCVRGDFEKLNFPGSDDVWKVMEGRPDDEDIHEAQKNWAKLDLDGVCVALVKYARKLDPVLRGVQTISDLADKTDAIEDACLRAMDMLRIEAKRAQNEYDRASTTTLFLCDQKDNLLSRWRNLEDQYAAHAYRYERLLPFWRQLITALKSLDAATKKMKETSP